MSTCLGKASFCFWAEFQTFEVGQNCKTKKEHRESSFFFKFSKTKIKDFNMDFSLFSPKNLANLIKTKKKVRESYKKIVDFQNLMKIEFCQRLFFAILTIHNLPWGHVRSHKKNLCPIGSAVLTFIRYKQKDVCGFHKKIFGDFQKVSKFNENRILLEAILFEILIIQKHSQGPRKVPHSRFDVCWIQTNRKAKYIYKYTRVFVRKWNTLNK